MSQQFPSFTPAESPEAWQAFIREADSVKDSRIYLWLVQWAVEAAQAKVVEAEERLMRQEKFGYDQDAEKTRTVLKSYWEAHTVATRMEAWIRMRVIEITVRGGNLLSSPDSNPGSKATRQK